MPHAPLAAALFAAALTSAGESCDGADLTTEQLHAASPLAAALNARVRPPAPADCTDSAEPAWLKMLTPRSASGQVTEVAGGDFSSTELAVQSTHGLRGVPPFVTITPALSLLTTDGPTTEAFSPPAPVPPALICRVNSGDSAPG